MADPASPTDKSQRDTSLLEHLRPGRELSSAEEGQSTPEYALVIVLVATVVIGLIPVARESLTRLFKSVIDHVVGLF